MCKHGGAGGEEEPTNTKCYENVTGKMRPTTFHDHYRKHTKIEQEKKASLTTFKPSGYIQGF